MIKETASWVTQHAMSRASRIKDIPVLNRWSRSSAHVPSKEKIEGFKKSQRIAISAVRAVAEEVQPGWTEKYTAKLLDTYLQDCGVKSFFHWSFAWFGDRTRFLRFKTPFEFLPTNRMLKENDAIILDVAPNVEGFVSDVGYTVALQKHEGLEKCLDLLRYLRKTIPGLFSRYDTSKEIWMHVNKEIISRGFVNCHRLYPFSVLGHRVHHIASHKTKGILTPFSWQAYWAMSSRGLFNELLGKFHTGSLVGLWAVEPHIGKDNYGAKFEEILVVTDKKAMWLERPNILDLYPQEKTH